MKIIDSIINYIILKNDLNSQSSYRQDTMIHQLNVHVEQFLTQTLSRIMEEEKLFGMSDGEEDKPSNSTINKLVSTWNNEENQQIIKEIINNTNKIDKKETKKRKKATMPSKKNLSAYILFSNRYRSQVKKELDDGVLHSDVANKNKNSLIIKRLAEMWNHLKISDNQSDIDEHNELQNLSKNKKDEINSDTEEHKDPEKVKKPAKQKNVLENETDVIPETDMIPDADDTDNEKPTKKHIKNKKEVKKPKTQSAYMYFCERFRNDVKESLGAECKSQDIMKEFGVRWNNLKNSNNESDMDLMKELQELVNNDKN